MVRSSSERRGARAGNDGRMQKTMSYERWEELSEHGKHVCRHVVCDQGEVPPQLRGGKL